MYFKAQSSIEYLAVVGFGLLMATPFIGLVQQDVINLRTDSQDARFTSSLDEMESAISRADALGESAQTSFTLNVPENIENARVIDNRNIVFTQNRSGELTNYTKLLDSNVSATSLPTERGRYRFTAQSSGGEVVLKYNEFIADFRALDPIIVGNEVRFQDESLSSRKIIDTREWYVNSSLELSGSETFSYTFSDSQVYNVSLKIAATDGSTDQVSKLYKAEESEVLAFSVESQSEWNLGTFSRASADRNDNSGNLGLGYLNGSNPSASSLEEGLVGYWRMDRAISGDGGTVKDYSRNGEDGISSGGVSTGQPGVLGTKAFNFTDDDNDYVEFGQNYQYNDTDEFSLSFWINTDKVDQNDRALGFDTTDAWGLLYLTFDTGNNELGFRGDSNIYLGQNKGVAKPGEGWTHVIVTHNGSGGMKMYENGVQVDSANSATWQTPDDIFVAGDVGQGGGIRWSGAADNYDGVLDEIRIYDRELSSSDAENLYISGKPFKGNYTSQAIDNSETQNWKELEIQASINSTTEELTVTFETLKNSFNYFTEQAYTSLIDWNQGAFNKTTADEVVTEYNYISELEASTQQGFNEGSFNGTSADRKNNSGDLGLGYLNGSNPSAKSLDQGLEGYWRFDGSSAKDYSGNGNDGSLTGGVNTGARGVLGTSSMEFDGTDDSVDVGDNIAAGNFTISTWVKGDSFGHTNYPLAVSEWQSSQNRDYLLGYHTDQSTLYAQVNDENLDNKDTLYGPTPIVGEWYHMALTFNGSKAALYVNGSLADSKTASFDQTSSGLVIGSKDDGGNYWNGSIDEIRAYNRSLSAKEVGQLYFQGMDGKFSGDYTAKKIDNSQETSWNKVEVNASVPSDTSMNATFKALDSSGSLIDSQEIDLSEGLSNYSLGVSSSEDAEVFINGTSSNVTKSWEFYEIEVFSREAKNKIEGLRIGYGNDSSGDKLVGYWRMDRNVSGSGGAVIDYSGHNLDGSTVGGVSNTSGILNTGAKDFSGSNDLVTFGDIEVGGWDEVSASAWFKTGSISSNSRILAKDQAGTPGAFIIRHDGSNLEWYVRDGGSNSWVLAEASVSVEDSKWHHVATTVDRADSEIVLFLDGQRVASNSFSASTLDDSDNEELVIGGGSDISNPEQEWNGVIDEVSLYNSSLSSQKVEELYFNGRPFQGNYSARKIENSQETSWKRIEINASVPSDTDLTAEFESLDSGDNVVDREFISVDSGSSNKNYSLGVQASENAKLSFNGTSNNVSETWKVYDYQVYSGEREVDQSESFSVQDGFNEFSLGVGDSKDARIKLNGSSSDVAQSWSVSNISVFTQ